MLDLPLGTWSLWARASGTIVLVLVLAVGATAVAQPRNVETQLFLPPAGGGSTFTIDRPAVPRHLTAVFGVAASWAHQPFVRSDATAGGVVVVPGGAVVRNLIQLEALAALGLFELLEIGVAVPMAIVESDADPFGPLSAYAWNAASSDLRLSAKVPILRGDFALSARFVAQLPTGDFQNYQGNEYWIATPSVALAWSPGPLILSSEVGFRFRQRRTIGDFEQDDEIALAGGVTVPIIPEIEVIAEAQMRIGVGGRSLTAAEVPAEADLGARFRPASGLSIEVGAGTGLLAGYGAPTSRVFTTLRYATERTPCSAGPEDYDGFDDGDFCADPDNDGDGRLDSVDLCPNDAEDDDGFADDDGCPDTDNDADGVVDPQDTCPTQSEDRDGYQDEDGCPEPDNDQDGVSDGNDDCPMEPEDQDQYQDEDGCPEPGPARASVTVTDTRILISERIYFDFDRDTIRSVSMPLLDQVAAVIAELPASMRVRVEGYTDNEGIARYNLDLSYRRARAVVEYLAGRGVARDRLEYRGYGSVNPVAPNDSPDGRALNRRVEFTILHAGESAGRRRQPAPTAPAPSERR